MPADYDGDGRTDPAVYVPDTGAWFILNSRGGYTTFQMITFGLSTDIPVPSDFDGDGKADLALYRSGSWLVLTSRSSYTATMTTIPWGLATDIPVAGDLPHPAIRIEAAGTQITERLSWDQDTVTHEPQVIGPATHVWTRT